MSRYTVDWNPGVRDFLEHIGARADVIEFIDQIDDPKIQGKLANEVRKHPKITLDEIQAKFTGLPQKREPNQREVDMLHALGLAHREPDAKSGRYGWRIDTPFGEWAVIQMMKYRHQPQTSEKWLDLPEDVLDIEETEHLFLRLRDWANSVLPRLASFSLDQAFTASEEWHRAVSGQGKGLVYDNTGEVIHDFGDGWTIRTVKTPNDLKVEGTIMQHCVASYAGVVEQGRSRIFSLRDPNNMPHVTIELKGDTNEVVQVQGKQDKKPIEKYRERVGEWLQSIDAFRTYNSGSGQNDITYRVWEQYDVKDAAYAIGDYYGQKDVESYGGDEDYGISMIEEIEWDDPAYVLESVIDKYEQNFKRVHDPKTLERNRDYYRRRIAELDAGWVENLSSSLVDQCERGEIDEETKQESIDFRKKKLFEEAAKHYYGLYQVDDETGYWAESDWVDKFFEDTGKTPVELGDYNLLPDEYLVWANQQVPISPVLMLCRTIIEKLGYRVFPLDTAKRDAPGQGILF